MDIIQLLEVLKPAKNVFTVQIANDKDQWASFFDLLKAVIPAIATGGVAWLAMNKSHQQYKENSKRQSEEFKLGIEQQLKTLKLNARLATEIELKKENCKEVRDATINFISHASTAYRYSFEFHQLVKNNIPGQEKNRDNAHELFMLSLQNMATSKFMILSFLDQSIEMDKAFTQTLREVDEDLVMANKMPGNMGDATKLGMCLVACSTYLKNKQLEITKLSETV